MESRIKIGKLVKSLHQLRNRVGHSRRKSNCFCRCFKKERHMGLKGIWNRRKFLAATGSLAAAMVSPVRSFGRKLAAAPDTPPITGFGQTGNVYEELGVTTVINCQGTMTMLGGSLPHPELEAVMALAGKHFVSIPELEVAAGNRIAEMLKL